MKLKWCLGLMLASTLSAAIADDSGRYPLRQNWVHRSYHTGSTMNTAPPVQQNRLRNTTQEFSPSHDAAPQPQPNEGFGYGFERRRQRGNMGQ